MKKYKSNKFYYDNSAVLGIPAIFYIILGGRGVGKTYSTQKYCIKRWKKTGEPFCWLRLKEPSVRKLLSNNAKDLIDSKLISEFNLNPEKFKVKLNTVYYDDMEFCRVMALSTFYQDKGIAMNRQTEKKKVYDGILKRELKKFRTIVLDELNAERSEKRTFDIVYALVNQLENLCRLDIDRRIFMLGNTLEEGSDILANAFNFIPNEFGIYRLHNKRAVIHYVEDSDKYREARKNSIAGILTPNESTFTNKIESDLDLLIKDSKKSYLKDGISYVIDFGNGKRFAVHNGLIISNIKIPKTYSGRTIAMRPYINGLPYYKEFANAQIEHAQQRRFKFDMLYTLKQFMSQIKLLKEN